MKEVWPILIGGLVLFIYSITSLSINLQDAFSENAKEKLHRYSSNVWKGLLLGTLLTVIMGSSSAIIIITIIFINSGALTFRNAMGIIMGANIGTTMSSQIIALDAGKYAFIIMAAGMLTYMFSKNKKVEFWSKITLFFGMLFFGLFLMEHSTEPLKDNPKFIEWITKIENSSVVGAMIGGLITLIIQSSSATVGIAIVTSKQGLLNFAGATAIMLGAELGTCSDTLIATIRGSRQAIKAGMFHLLFNLSTIIIALIVFDYFVDFVLWISDDASISHKIANAHVLFNIGGVILGVIFLPWMEKAMNVLIPEKKTTA